MASRHDRAHIPAGLCAEHGEGLPLTGGTLAAAVLQSCCVSKVGAILGRPSRLESAVVLPRASWAGRLRWPAGAGSLRRDGHYWPVGPRRPAAVCS